MKTYKKTISSLLIVMMLMCTIIPTAFAVQNAVIDTSQTGTLHIYKYQVDDETVYNSLTTRDNGEINSNIPSAATPYSGVTFKIKKIADITSDYYTAGRPFPTVANAKTMSAIGNELTQTTNGSGYATFSGLSLGLYFVEETNAPSQTITKTEDFIVSVPMTNSTRDSWNYNVYVYPKNLTKYSSVSVHKTGLNNAALSGAVFNLQAQLNGSSTWTTVDTLTTNSSGNATSVSTLPVKTNYRLVETTAPTDYILDHAHDTTTFYINETGNAVKSSSDSTSVGTNNTITISNTKPQIEKFIDKSNGANIANSNYETNDLVQTSTVNKNITAPGYSYYTIKVTTPDVDMSTLTTFTVSDLFGGNRYPSSGPSMASFKLVNIYEKGSSSPIATSNRTISYSKSDSSLTYNDIYNVSFNVGSGTVFKKNTVYYLSFSIVYGAASGTTIPNEATLTYTSETGTNTTSDIDSNQTQLYVGGYQLLKTNDQNQPLENVQFSLYATENDAKNGTNPVMANNASSISYTSATDTFTTNSNGYLNISGIYFGDDINGSKTYWLVEKKTVSGYNLLKEPIQITVNKNSHQYSGTNGTGMKIINTPKSELPMTGGLGGMSLVIILSVVLIGTGCVLFIVMKKNKKMN